MSARNATILRHHAPKAELQAKFSIEFAMASAFIAGNVGLSEVSDGFVVRPEVQAFLPKVRTRTDVPSDPLTGHSRYDQVDVRLKDGKVLSSGEITVARGAASVPLGEAEMETKFADCIKASGKALNADALFSRLANLERLKGASELHAAAQ